MPIRWTTQNEEIDSDGLLLEGAASFAAEMKLLRSLDCPDTNSAILVSVEVIGQAESLTVADVSADMAR